MVPINRDQTSGSSEEDVDDDLEDQSEETERDSEEDEADNGPKRPAVDNSAQPKKQKKILRYRRYGSDTEDDEEEDADQTEDAERDSGEDEADNGPKRPAVDKSAQPKKQQKNIKILRKRKNTQIGVFKYKLYLYYVVE